MPLQATSGAATYDAFGGGAPVPVTKYIEEVFSTYLYTGNGTSQTITNGLNLSRDGGLVWLKGRSGATDHALYDTARGATKDLVSNSSAAETTQATGLTAFSSTGFSIGALAKLNTNAATYVAWALRQQSKFFQVVTYTGTGVNRTVSHNLGSVPGCIMVKRTDIAANWQVYHRSLGNTGYLVLNTTAVNATSATRWNSTTPTSTVFSLGTDVTVNASGGTYVAYLFAHDSGGFGESGAENVISCGVYTGNGSTSGPTITLGYEPQLLLIKKATGTVNSWVLIDTMRGFPFGTGDAYLYPNLSTQDDTGRNTVNPTATGFNLTANASEVNTNLVNYIYIAIRRGPMKVPTSGESVFGLSARTGTGANATVSGSAGVSDAVLIKNRGSAVADLLSARLMGQYFLQTSSSSAEQYGPTTILQNNPWDVMDGVNVGTTSTTTNASGSTFINYLFDRAPNFMDISCYVGTSFARTLAHNLKVVPELMIVKDRTAGFNWAVYSSTTGATNGLYLDATNAAFSAATFWNNTAPTASVFTVGSNNAVNSSGFNYINLLFATCPGVSKVGSYTGTAATLQIDCGFTGGARFVLIKRTDSTGSWYVWDSARGIVAGDDPYFLLNSLAAEVTNTDYIDTYSAGFEITSTAPADINASGGTYIFLAIA